ncbi:MAG: hypothetical protein Q9201_007655 [Fulgogasparrea decipioides]
MYTFMLGAAFVVSAEELTLGSASCSYAQRRSPTAPNSFQEQQPFQELRNDNGPLVAQLRAGREVLSSPTTPQDARSALQQQLHEESGVLGLLRKLWYGNETEGWQKRRIEEEMEALEEGRGYGGLIGDAVREVFGGKVEREDVERFNEERRREREREREREEEGK